MGLFCSRLLCRHDLMYCTVINAMYCEILAQFFFLVKPHVLEHFSNNFTPTMSVLSDKIGCNKELKYWWIIHIYDWSLRIKYLDSN